MMAFIRTVPLDAATGEVRAIYERNQARLGFVANYTKLFSHRPPVAAAWEALLTSIRANLDARRYELVTLAAARAMRSSYCSLVHGRILRDRFYTAPELTAILDGGAGPLSPAEAALMRYAEQVARDASQVTEADIQALRDHGLSDTEIFDVAAAVAARCFFSKLLDSLGAQADAVYEDLEEGLRQRFEVGRAVDPQAPERLAVDAGPDA
jgi:uncharacterized peroxidase-related enzyme